MRLLKLIVLTGFLFGPALALGACNTVEGVGKDISATARTVKKAL